MTWVLGNDVSHWQTPSADFARKLHDAGGRYVWIKSSQGRGIHDAGMAEHHKFFAGVPRGAYHFLDFSGADAEAANFLATTKGRPWEMPHVLDAEKGSAGGKRATADYLLRMLDIVERGTGRVPVIYTGPGWWGPTVEPDPRFARYPLWVARYPSAYNDGHVPAPDATTGTVAPWPRWSAWQYSSANNLDRNICSPDVFTVLTGSQPTNPPAPAPVNPIAPPPSPVTPSKDWLDMATLAEVEALFDKKAGDLRSLSLYAVAAAREAAAHANAAEFLGQACLAHLTDEKTAKAASDAAASVMLDTATNAKLDKIEAEVQKHAAPAAVDPASK